MINIFPLTKKMFNYIHFTVKISKLCSKPNASDKDPGRPDIESQIQWSFLNNAMKTTWLQISYTNKNRFRNSRRPIEYP